VVYATGNIRGMPYNKEELNKILQTNNVKVAVITEMKKTLTGT
jgi:hypothetical protein